MLATASNPATMSKITIFLCAAFFTAAVDASYLTKALELVQQSMNAFVEFEITKIEQLNEAIMNTTTNVIAELDMAANDFIDKFQKDVENTKDETVREVHKIIREAEVYCFVSECEQMIKDIDEIGNVTLRNMTSCVVAKKEEGRVFINKVQMSARAILANVSSIREASHRCTENVEGVISHVNGIACTKVEKMKRNLIAAANIPTLVVNGSKMMYYVTTFQSSLNNCKSTRGLDTLKGHLKTIAHDINICVELKKSKQRSNQM